PTRLFPSSLHDALPICEIEAVMCRHPAVRECSVVPYELAPGDRRLALYVAPRVDERPSALDLRAFLKSRLPEFMIPSTFTLLERSEEHTSELQSLTNLV